MKSYLKTWYGNKLTLSAVSSLENPTTLTREFPRYTPTYDKGPIEPVGHRINLKIVVDPNDRLKAFSKIINDNVGNEDTYAMMENFFNPSDKASLVPNFKTKVTLPPVPDCENFKCSALAANAEDIVRASKLMTIEEETEGSEEDQRQNALIGVGIGAPGLFLGLYGSSEFPGGQVMEYRNDIICRAFSSGDYDQANLEIENFFPHLPRGNMKTSSAIS